jgi:phosphoenolpyruvate phosphomutase
MLRASYPAMVKVAETILDKERSFETDQLCMSVKQILELIPGGK